MGAKSGPFEFPLARGTSPSHYTGPPVSTPEELRAHISSSRLVLPVIANAALSPEAIEEETLRLSQIPRGINKLPFVRQFDCCNYNVCLSLAAALNWNSFTCFRCKGAPSEQLIWRAHHKANQDKSLSQLWDLPKLKTGTK